MTAYTADELDALRDEFPDYEQPDCRGSYCGERNCATCGEKPEPEEEEELTTEQIRNLLAIGLEPENGEHTK